MSEWIEEGKPAPDFELQTDRGEPLCELGKLVKGSGGAGAVAQGLDRVLAALE